MDIKLKRIYEDKSKDDGYRVLGDRLWPRGMTKEKAQIDLWLKDTAPSTELRKWFHHQEQKWEEFIEKYIAELDGIPDVVGKLEQLASKGKITLLYAARDEQHNHASVLKKYIEQRK